MADQNDQSPPNSTYHQRRRSSFVGQAFSDMFNRSSRPSESSGTSPPAQGPIATAAAEASRRRLSISTLGMGTSPNQSSPISARMREGFNWADNMRSRAERSSISGMSASPPTGGWTHARSKSIAVMDTPVRDNPRPVNVPDQFQERILKGDFIMD